MAARLALELFHGRRTPGEALDDWGSQGPVFLVEWVHMTYCSSIRFGLEGPACEGELEFVNDLVYYGGVYYGDWTVYDLAELKQAEGLAARVESYDSTKAIVPDPSEPQGRTS
jgi:hypothetical protein